MKLFDKIFSKKPKSIYKSIEEGNINEIENHLKDTKNLDADTNLDSLLHYTINNCESNYFKTIEFLLDRGADVNSHHSKLLETPLHRLCARAKPQLDVITMLLERGADVNGTNLSGKTPVFYCSFNYSVELLNLLVKYGADINITDKQGNTLLHDDYVNCFDEYFEEFLKVLISMGLDINLKNSLGFTPLDLCENEEIDEILIKYGGEYR